MHRNLLATWSSSLVAASFVSIASFASIAGCAEAAPPKGGDTAVTKSSGAAAGTTRVVSFSVSMENLNVDKVGLRDGFMKPDGNRDLAFTTTIDGPYEALFVVSTNAKGEPSYGLRADTLTGKEEIPIELGGVIDTGKMTVGIGVVEAGKFINGESGSAHAGAGVHSYTLYVPNTATLQAGSFVRLYVKTPAGTLVPGPVTPY